MSCDSYYITGAEKYLISSLLEIFGKEIQENIIIIVTKATSSSPPVFQSLEELGISTKNNIIVNNIAFFGNKNDPFQATTNQFFWNLATESYKKLLTMADSFTERSLISSC